MLEQAVIDAQALKEAAIKNAEQEVLEKYSGDIKEAVNTLLEQEVDPMALDPMADPMAADPMAGAPMEAGAVEEGDKIASKLSLKALDETKFAEDNEEVELDLDALKEALNSSKNDFIFEASEFDLEGLLEDDKEDDEWGGNKRDKNRTSKDKKYGGLKGVKDYEPVFEQEEVDEGVGSNIAKKAATAAGTALGTAAGTAVAGPAGGAVGGALGNKAVEKLVGEDEEELTEETLQNAIEEILKVDLENVPRGMIGTTHPTKIEQVDAVNIALAVEQDTAMAEQTDEWQAALKKIEKLEEHVKSLKSDKNRLVKDHKDLKSVARQVSDKLTELNNTNAKLVYQNRILESHSLNERQKEKLVEAVSNANSTEEAKVIYETLQDSLSSKKDNGPQSLNEAVSKNNRLVLKSNKKESQVSSSAIDRMKKLAGII